jgi:type I restriction enzyme S subunit
MGSEWRVSTWGDTVSLEYGKALRGYQTEKGAYRVFGSNGPIGWHSDSLASGPGVVLGRKGAYRGVEYSKEPFWVIDTAYYVVPKKTLDLRWLYFAIKHYKLGEIDDGSPIPSTTRAAVYVKELLIPPICEQQAIASILGSLDDKIELNRQRNRTLEAMARALFQSWFVDFDPVKAKAAGKNPSGLKPEIAALFPDSFEESELGMIPKGWTCSSIRSVTKKVQYGYTASATSTPVGPRFLRITDIRGGRIGWNDVPSCDISESDEAKYLVQDGDVLVARTGAYTGDNVYLIKPQRAVFASYLVRFQFHDIGIGRLVGEFMRTSNYFDFVRSALGGSAQPNANAQTLSDCSMIFPCTSVANAYYELVRSTDLIKNKVDEENCTLALIRDNLLPKLVSGELRIPDAERIVSRMV